MSLVALTASPQVEDVDRIAAMANPVIRNLEITECYAELTAAMRAQRRRGRLVQLRDVGVAAGRPYHPR